MGGLDKKRMTPKQIKRTELDNIIHLIGCRQKEMCNRLELLSIFNPEDIAYDWIQHEAHELTYLGDKVIDLYKYAEPMKRRTR